VLPALHPIFTHTKNNHEIRGALHIIAPLVAEIKRGFFMIIHIICTVSVLAAVLDILYGGSQWF
jgi:hypothetical protein